MSYSVINKFEKFKVPDSTIKSARVWDDAEAYKTSYLCHSLKNPLAMKNSTVQLDQTRSSNLRSISCRDDYKEQPPKNIDFINYDYNHLYRTSYGDMYSRTPKLYNTYYIPRYGGFVPGMKSENPFGATFTKIAKKQVDNFDNKRFGRETNVTYKEWKYNPLSKTIGSFWNQKAKRMNETVQSSLGNHTHTTRLRDSGFSENLYPSKMNSAWLHPCFNSDMIRTEYRIQYNKDKSFHYKQPTFSTGVLKQTEKNYKYT